MIIDVHGHLDRRAARDLAPIAVGMHTRSSGVDRIVVSNRDAADKSAGGLDLDETNANMGCLAASQACPTLVPLYWVRPGRFDSNVHAFAGAMRTEPFAGAIFSPLLNDFDVRNHELLAPYLNVLGQVGRPAVFRAGTDERADVQQIITLARRHARVPFILFDVPGNRGWTDAVADVRHARERHDVAVYLETSGAHLPEVLNAVSTLGAGALLFGSGGTVSVESDAQRCRETLDKLRESLPAGDFARIAGENARELLGLEAPSP